MEIDTTQKQSRIRLRKEEVIGGPLTSVALPNDYEHCLIARGPWLEVCPLALSSQRRKRHLIFPGGGTIHGIRESPGRQHLTALFGGRQVCLVEGNITLDESLRPTNLEYQGCRQRQLTVSDWIWDVKLERLSGDDRDGSTSESRSEVVMALALANNTVEIWKFRRIRHPFKSIDLSDNVFEAIRCLKINGSTRCITYSMRFFGWSEEQAALVVASGTVSNEILLWPVMKAGEASQCQFDTETMTKQQKESHRLVGHEGVIHSVVFNSTGDKLVSSSDDRSLRLWQRGKCQNWSLAWTAWGHTARIWNATFAFCGIVSCGEDGTVRVWSEETGSQLAEIRNYNCQSQWCLDVHEDLAIIGCNDGSAKLYELNSRIAGRGNHGEYGHGASVRAFLVPDDRIVEGADQGKDNKLSTENSLGQKKGKNKIDSQIICGLKFYCESDTASSRMDKILVATRGGSLYSFCLRHCAWTTLFPWYDASLPNLEPSDGSCLVVHPCGTMSAVGTKKGQILLLFDFEEATKCRRIVLDAQKYRSIQILQWLDDETLLSFHIKGIVLCWHISLQRAGSLQFVCDTTLGALPLCSAYDEAARYLAIGDSRGNVTAFSLGTSESKNPIALQPMFVVHRAHKKEHVTSMAFARNGRLLISVGNDGCIHKCSINADGTWRQGTSVPLSFVSSLSHIWLIKNETKQEQIIVGGYYSNIFVAADALTGYELFRVETGGRQRIQDSFIGPRVSCRTTHGFVICVSRKDGRNELRVQNFNQPDPTRPLLPCKSGIGIALHGEPIFDSCFFQTRPEGGRTILLSGSEDCQARLSVYEASSLISSDVLPPQESCVRAVAASRHPLTSSTLLVVGGGKLTVQFFLVEDSGPLNVSFLGWGRFTVQASIEHRINAVTAAPLESQGSDDAYHLVVSGDSNGSICIFAVQQNVGASRNKHAAEGYVLSTQSRPILSLEICPVANRYILFAGTSGGEVLFWDLPCRYEHLPFDFFPLPLTGRYNAHQMGTNCLSSTVILNSKDKAEVVICSGGDDQAITVCMITFRKVETRLSPTTLDVANVCLVTTKEASLSAIKGLHIIEPDLLVSVGYSQRLCIWRRTLDGSLQLVHSKPTDIADVNCLAYHSEQSAGGNTRRDIIAVLGEGVELFSIERNATSTLTE